MEALLWAQETTTNYLRPWKSACIILLISCWCGLLLLLLLPVMLLLKCGRICLGSPRPQESIGCAAGSGQLALLGSLAGSTFDFRIRCSGGGNAGGIDCFHAGFPGFLLGVGSSASLSVLIGGSSRALFRLSGGTWIMMQISWKILYDYIISIRFEQERRRAQMCKACWIHLPEARTPNNDPKTLNPKLQTLGPE